MNFEDAKSFMENNHRSVVTTYQADGAAHACIVVCGAYEGHAAFVSVHNKSRKVRNLRRDPRCTVLAVSDNWRSWVSVEGEAKLSHYANTGAEEVRVLLRKVYRACSNSDHPNWEEFDEAMKAQEGVVILVKPKRIYGQIR